MPRSDTAITAMALYAVMKVLSENALWDTISALGMMVCFYYGITAAACVWYFRGQLRRSTHDLLVKGVVPGLGAVVLAAVFVQTAIDAMDPAYGSGSSVLGVGSVFVIGIGLLVVGLVLALVRRQTHPAFFRGETLHTDTPSLVLPD